MSYCSRLVVALVTCLLALPAFASNGTETDGQSSVSVMAYNLANLFDTKHDEGKADYSYLPYADKQTAEHKAICDKETVYPWRMECMYLNWNDNAYAAKLVRVSNAIKTINNGYGPDILILEEVENIGVLQKLNNEYLTDLGYKTVVLIEGNDDRGIDQAVLSRLPLAGTPQNFPLPLHNAPGDTSRKDPSLTRGLLNVPLMMPDNKVLQVFAVHLPSGDVHDLRAQALAFLETKRQAIVSGNAMALVAGDFNINSAEDAQFNMYGGTLSKWNISHHLGCQGCLGTEYYKTKNEWSFLDAIGTAPSMNQASGKSSWYVDAATIQIPQFDPQQSANGFPHDFDAKTFEGVSDHYPIFEILRRR